MFFTQEKYDEWKKTQKYFIVEFEYIKQHEDGTVELIIRNGEFSFKVGDWFGGQEVLKFEAYQKDMDICGGGMTGMVKLSGMPQFIVQETDPYMIEYCKNFRTKDVIIDENMD